MRGCAQQLHSLIPVNAASTRPEMGIEIVMIVMHVSGANAAGQHVKGLMHAARQVSMAGIKANAEIGIVQVFQNFPQLFRSRQVTGRIFRSEEHTSELQSQSNL